MTPAASRTGPIRLAVWYGKGGVGKSTTTLMLALFVAAQRQRALVIDLDPECGTSRDFLGNRLPSLPENLKTFLQSPLPLPPPILPSGIDGIDLVACAPDEQRFFRLYPERSTRLREALDMLEPAHRWMLMDVPNQFDNIAELGLLAADFLLLPVELTADCVERFPTVLRIIDEAKALNPNLRVLGALALASTPRAGQELRLSAKERLIYREYEAQLGKLGLRMFKTVMFRSSTTVEEARSNADARLLHWTVRRRFHDLLAEILLRCKTALPSSPSRHAKHSSKAKQGRTAAPAHA